MSRIATLASGRARTAALAAAIRRAAGSTARQTVDTVRIAPDSVTAYDWRPAQLSLSPAAARAVAELMREVRPDIDWTVSHDYALTTGMLRRSPAAGERGHDPVADKTFGGSGPVFLPRPGDAPQPIGRAA